MSQYKSAIRSQPPQELSENSKYRSKVRQLLELFPTWSIDDLQSLLSDVNGDVEVAATRISDGAVEQWGEVSRKKDKKAPTSAHASKPAFSARGDPRGARGGRGGRGSPGRGGAATRGRGGPPRGSANGHIPHADSTTIPSIVPVIGDASAVTDETQPIDNTSPQASTAPLHDQHNGLTPSNSGWTASSQQETSTPGTSVSGTPSAWGTTTATELNGAGSTPLNKQPPANPATSKRSWAQIAKPREKPAPPPAPSQPLAPVTTSAAPSLPLPVPEPEYQTEPQQNGWEEPTTVEAPTWDDDSQTKQTSAAENWPPSTDAPSSDESKSEVSLAPAAVEETPEVPEPPVAPAPEPVVESKPEPKPPVPAPATTASPAQVTATPSPKLSSRPTGVAHRSSARYKIPDQPVTMPISFGSSLDKVGMQFGSLGLDGSETTQTEPEAPVASEPESPPVPKAKPQQEPVAPPAVPPATAPASSNTLTSVFQQQQAAPPQAAQPPPLAPQASVPLHSLPAPTSQPISSNQIQSSHAATTASPLQQYTQQQTPSQQQQPTNPQQQTHQPTHLQSQTQTQHIPHLPQQIQQSHHTYSQHGLPTHIDPSQQAQAPSQQPLPSSTHTSYFRQSEPASNSPYFHTSTPPASQSQDSQYGSFGQLGSQGQLQQGNPLGAFGASEYGYSESPRGFYESYAQQQHSYRGPLSHDDGKTIPGSQQTAAAAAAALPSSNNQPAQQHASQAPQQTPTGGQGPQQNYPPPPVPYYYTHAYPQNQYYGAPYNSGYVPQPYVKYPVSVFPPGPPGPASATTPTTKQPGGNVGVGVQAQTNPYNQGLYQQGGYDDYQPHPHHSQHQHQHAHSLGLNQNTVGVGSGEYGKQVYGGGVQGGVQGFMGLGGQSGAGGSGPTSNAGPRTGTSPETPYKPYSSKEIGVNAGRGGPTAQQGGQGQGQGGQSGAQGQGFYGGNRFGAGVGVGASGAGGVGAGIGGGPQSAHHQQGGPQHLGYPQGANDPGFYGYQPRQQGGYWQ